MNCFYYIMRQSTTNWNWDRETDLDFTLCASILISASALASRTSFETATSPGKTQLCTRGNSTASRFASGAMTLSYDTCPKVMRSHKLIKLRSRKPDSVNVVKTYEHPLVWSSPHKSRNWVNHPPPHKINSFEPVPHQWALQQPDRKPSSTFQSLHLLA